MATQNDGRPANLAPNAVWPPKAEQRSLPRTVIANNLPDERRAELEELVTTNYGPPEPDTEDARPQVRSAAAADGDAARPAARGARSKR